MQIQNKKSNAAPVSRFLSDPVGEFANSEAVSVVSCSPCRGFTLIELLITVAISTIMTGIVVSNYRDYGINAYFVNASEDVVLALRQAQVYGAGGKTGLSDCLEPDGETPAPCSYGVHFSVGTSGLILFVDKDSDKVFDTEEEIETVKWKNAITLTGLKCNTVGCSVGLDITFMRPNPDAWIAETSGATTFSYSTAKITISNGATPPKSTTVTISQAGQISLK